MFAQWLVRAGLAIVFLYMGVDKFARPDVWLVQMPEFLRVYGLNFMFVLGGIECLIGLLLLVRSYFRLGALGAVVILVGAISTLGVNDIAARDVGLLFGAVALLLPWEHHLTPRSVVRNYLSMLKGKPPGH
ncbi:DoxX family protein [Candidatus Woesearchaeota archaeon]|nr:DoxX family protein [Candidatus Woesearchaeota archaeon]